MDIDVLPPSPPPPGAMQALGDGYRTEMENRNAAPLPRPVFSRQWLDNALGPDASLTIQSMPEHSHFFIGCDPGRMSCTPALTLILLLPPRFQPQPQCHGARCVHLYQAPRWTATH